MKLRRSRMSGSWCRRKFYLESFRLWIVLVLATIWSIFWVRSINLTYCWCLIGKGRGKMSKSRGIYESILRIPSMPGYSYRRYSIFNNWSTLNIPLPTNSSPIPYQSHEASLIFFKSFINKIFISYPLFSSFLLSLGYFPYIGLFV